ncbi:MAG: MarR family transcriptional regulator [bacterium]|nr:MarR family transcriptional regulator [bacterium]
MTRTDTQLDGDAARLWALLFKLVLDGEKRVAALLHTHHLTTPQFYVLKTLIEQHGRCPIGQIAHLHSLTNATMTGLVSRLESMGLVEREPNSADRRSVMVILTPAGQARFDAVQAALSGHLRALLALLPDADRESLLRDVERYAAIIESYLSM